MNRWLRNVMRYHVFPQHVFFLSQNVTKKNSLRIMVLIWTTLTGLAFCFRRETVILGTYRVGIPFWLQTLLNMRCHFW